MPWGGSSNLLRPGEPEAERIRLAFDMAGKGEPFWKILHVLQELEDRDGTGIVWEQRRLHRFLTTGC